MQRGIVLHVFQQRARTAADDDRRLIDGEFLCDRLLHFGELVRVGNSDALDADRMAECLKIDGSSRIALQIFARGRVLLMTGHTGDRVIENDDRRIGCVIRNIDKAVQAGVHEGRVADDCDGLVLGLLAEHLVEAVQAGDRRAHADRPVNGFERLCGAERIAADIAGNGDLVLCQRIEYAAVRTSGTHNRRTDRQLLRICGDLGGLTEQLLCDDDLIQLADVAEDLLAFAFDAECLCVCLENAVELLDDVNGLALCGKIKEKLVRQRVRHAELQVIDLAAERILCVLI